MANLSFGIFQGRLGEKALYVSENARDKHSYSQDCAPVPTDSGSVSSVPKRESVYLDSPWLRALVQCIPYVGSGLDTIVAHYLTQIEEKRMRVFFDELAKGPLELTEQLVQEVEFLHRFTAATRAALRTERAKKIRYFARLLSASVAESLDLSEYEEYLDILDDLSEREIAVLVLLSKYEAAEPCRPGENELQRANRFWRAFLEDLESELGISKEVADPILTRLNRTGLYETFTGSYFNYTGGKGKLTPLYWRLERLVRLGT